MRWLRALVQVAVTVLEPLGTLVAVPHNSTLQLLDAHRELLIKLKVAEP